MSGRSVHRPDLREAVGVALDPLRRGLVQVQLAALGAVDGAAVVLDVAQLLDHAGTEGVGGGGVRRGVHRVEDEPHVRPRPDAVLVEIEHQQLVGAHGFEVAVARRGHRLGGGLPGQDEDVVPVHAFAAGAVSQDYRGGTPTIGGSGASATAGDGARRAQERLYANSVRQLLRDELERQLNPDAGELTAAFALWIEGSGRIRHWEIDERETTTLEPQREAALKLALDRSAGRLQLPPPPTAEQPMRFRLTVRAGG